MNATKLQIICIFAFIMVSMFLHGCAKVTGINDNDLTSANRIDKNANIDKYFSDQNGNKKTIIVRFTCDHNGKINIDKIYFNENPKDSEIKSARKHNREMVDAGGKFIDYITLNAGKKYSAYKPQIGKDELDCTSIFYSDRFVDPVAGVIITGLSPLLFLSGNSPQYSFHKINNNITEYIGNIITTKLHSDMEYVEYYAQSYESFTPYDMFKLYYSIRNKNSSSNIENLRPQIIAALSDLKKFKGFEKDSMYGSSEQTVRNNMIIDVSCFNVSSHKTGSTDTESKAVLNFDSKIKIRDPNKIKSYPVHITVRYAYAFTVERVRHSDGILSQFGDGTSRYKSNYHVEKDYVINSPDNILHDKVQIPFMVAATESYSGFLFPTTYSYKYKKIGEDGELFGDIINIKYK